MEILKAILGVIGFVFAGIVSLVTIVVNIGLTLLGFAIGITLVIVLLQIIGIL